MRLWLIRHGETQANIDGLYSGHAPTPLTARVLSKRKICIRCYMVFPLIWFYAVNWNGHSIPRDWFSVTASSPFISSLNSTKCFLATGRCDIIATSCKKMPKTIARGAMTGSMQSPRTVKDFRHFRNVWNALSQGLVNFSTIRIF